MKTVENSKTYMKTRTWLSFSLLSLALLTAISSFGQDNPDVEKALYLIDVERPKEGMALMQKTVAANPENAAMLYSLGYAQLKLGEKDKALATFDKGIQLDDKEALNYAGKGHLLLLNKKPEEAKVLLDKALSMSKSKKVNVLNAVAEAYMTDGKSLPNAIQLLNTAKKVGPNVTTYILLGDAHTTERQGGLAATAYEDGASIKKTDPKPYFKLGDLYSRNKNYTSVEEALNKSIAIDAKYAPAYKQLAYMYYRDVKDGAKAVQNYEKYLSLIESPDDKTKVVLAYFLFMAKDYAKANTMFKQFASAPDVSAETLKFYAFSLSEAGDLEQSRIVAEQFMSKAKPEDLTATDYASYGKLLTKLKDLKSDASLPKAEQDKKKLLLDSLALNAYTKSLELNPEQADVLEKAAEINVRLKHPERAIPQRKKLLAMNQKPSTNLFFLGLAYYYSEKYAQADSTFLKLEELQPNAPDGYLWEGRSKSSIDSLMTAGLAKPAFDKVVEKSLADPVKYKSFLIEAYGYLGAYYVNFKRDRATGKTYFTKILELDPNNAGAKKALDDIRQGDAMPAPKQ
jgi:tetratricopeptide (TPR) repeat protein